MTDFLDTQSDQASVNEQSNDFKKEKQKTVELRENNVKDTASASASESDVGVEVTDHKPQRLTKEQTRTNTTNDQSNSNQPHRKGLLLGSKKDNMKKTGLPSKKKAVLGEEPLRKFEEEEQKDELKVEKKEQKSEIEIFEDFLLQMADGGDRDCVFDKIHNERDGFKFRVYLDNLARIKQFEQEMLALKREPKSALGKRRALRVLRQEDIKNQKKESVDDEEKEMDDDENKKDEESEEAKKYTQGSVEEMLWRGEMSKEEKEELYGLSYYNSSSKFTEFKRKPQWKHELKKFLASLSASEKEKVSELIEKGYNPIYYILIMKADNPQWTLGYIKTSINKSSQMRAADLFEMIGEYLQTTYGLPIRQNKD